MKKSTKLEKIKELSGFSGCKIFLYKKGDLFFVRKISKSLEYNSRLKEQMKKQILFEEKFSTKKIHAPKIFNSGLIGDCFYFDMEFVNGENLINVISTSSLNELKRISKDLIKILGLFKKNKLKTKKNLSAYSLKKLNDILSKSKSKRQKNILEELKSPLKELPRVNATICHGDFTLENIMFDKSTKKYYLIDFLDSFVDHYWLDVVKLFQDLDGQWYAFRNKNLSNKQVSDKVSYLKRKIMNSSLYKNKYSKHHNKLLALNFSRILPYAHESDYDYLLKNIYNNISKTKSFKLPNFFMVGHPVSGGEEILKKKRL